MKLDSANPGELIPVLDDLAKSNGYGKIFAKIPEEKAPPFLAAGYDEEARIPRFFRGEEAAVFLGRYLDPARRTVANEEELRHVLELAKARKGDADLSAPPPQGRIRPLGPADADEMVKIYEQVFPSYPFPIHDPAYLIETMESHVDYFGVELDGKLVSISSAEMHQSMQNVEMTDFATIKEHRGSGYAVYLLAAMETAMRKKEMRTAYTIARAVSPGMNITFSKCGYEFGGRLVNNTNISGQIESMNVWYKAL